MIVRLIENQEELDAVYRLTHDAYLEQGYIKPQPDGMFKNNERYDRLPETDIFIAVDEDQIVGTVSMTRANLTGFPYDRDFPEEVEKIKHCSIVMGRYLAACWRIVTDSKCRHGLTVVLALMQKIMEESAKYHVHEMIFEFNPKHVKFYNKMLGIQPVCEKVSKTVDAPGVLMYVDGRHLACKWQDVCTKRRIEQTIFIKDFWWPTAKASPPSIWEYPQYALSLTGCVFGFPLLWAVLLYDKMIPAKY